LAARIGRRISSQFVVRRQPFRLWVNEEQSMSMPPAACVPTIWCPFPARINPHAAQVYQGTEAWLERFGLGDVSKQEQTSIAQVAYLAARFHPDTSPDILQFIANWYAWFFCQDDECDKSNLGADPSKLLTSQTRLLRILLGDIPNQQDNPIAHALYDLRLSSQQLASPCWMDQLVAGISEYFATMIWEANNRQHGLIPSLDTYVRLRPITGGLPIEQVLATLSYNIILPQHIQSSPWVQHITMLSDQAICWVNDLLSINKELQQGDIHNLVIVLQHERQMTHESATDYVIQLHNTAVRDFAELATSISSYAQADEPAAYMLQCYVQMLQTRIAGHADWATTALRYQMNAV
jgi:5-epi-alpha-selinene synthase